MEDGRDNSDAVGFTEADERERDLAPQNIVDTVQFGRRLRARRILEGFDRVGQLTHILRSRYGIDVSDRTIYAIERGEQMPHIDFYLAVCAALKIEQTYFWSAIRSDVIETIRSAR